MSIKRSKFRHCIDDFARAAHVFTIAGTILLSTAAGYTPAAQAQGLGSAINQATSLLNTSIGGGKQALPPTNLDSFVTQAGGMADLIYGDESDGLPPFFGFSQEHRINAVSWASMTRV